MAPATTNTATKKIRRTPAIALAGALLTTVPARAQDAAIEAAPDADRAAARGKYLMYAGGCITCHTRDADDAAPLGGGRVLDTRYGTFRTPNITPDDETGIGGWSEADFRAAMRHGRAPDGRPYYPAFPYPHYTGMTDGDIADLFAYLQTRAPVRNRVAAHDLDFPYNVRQGLWPWRWAFFDAGAFQPTPNKSAAWNRGAYLVRHLAHCGACHTPRNVAGARIAERELAGNPDGPEGRSVPNITPHADGIGAWSRKDLTFFLVSGYKPGGDVAGSGMSAVIEHSTSHLTEGDLNAIATYILSLPPRPDAG